jgi:NAD-dependent SIR2 family protein deacetylase
MLNKLVSGDCSNCESTYSIEYVEEFVSEDYPEHCPFCGEVIDELSEEYIEDDDSDIDEEEWE